MRIKYRFGAVIPAAGLSSRMGSFKPLLSCGGMTVIERTVSSALPFADTVVAVAGFRADELSAVLRRRFGDRLTIALNPDYASTHMLDSVRIGLSALGECDAFFLLPADMPDISRETYEALIKAYDPSREALVPILDGRRGHPPLISAGLIPEIMDYSSEGGLRAVLDRHTVHGIPVSDDGVLIDLDTPEDYERQTMRMEMYT